MQIIYCLLKDMNGKNLKIMNELGSASKKDPTRKNL
jgi:hypothetical protein